MFKTITNMDWGKLSWICEPLRIFSDISVSVQMFKIIRKKKLVKTFKTFKTLILSPEGENVFENV